MLLAFIKQPALFIFTDLDPSQVALDLNLGRMPNAHDWPSKYNRNVSYVKQHDIVRYNDKLNIPNLRFSLPIATQLSLYNYLLFFTGNCAIHKKNLSETNRTHEICCVYKKRYCKNFTISPRSQSGSYMLLYVYYYNMHTILSTLNNKPQIISKSIHFTTQPLR